MDEKFYNSISEVRRLTLISLFMLSYIDRNLNFKKEGTKSLATNQDEEKFTSFIYEETKTYIDSISGDKKASKEELMAHLCDKFEISKELLEKWQERNKRFKYEVDEILEGTNYSVRKQNTEKEEELIQKKSNQENFIQDTLEPTSPEAKNSNKQTWEEKMEMYHQELLKIAEQLTMQLKGEQQMVKEKSQRAIAPTELYIPNLYQQDLIDRCKKNMRLVEIAPEKTVAHQYALSDIKIEIRPVGKLRYSPQPSVDDFLIVYEITKTTPKRELKLERFGNISINKMDDPMYQNVVLTQLLGESNLLNGALHGYLGKLEKTKQKGYEITQSPEEYNAVVAWKKLLIEKQTVKKEHAEKLGGEAR